MSIIKSTEQLLHIQLYYTEKILASGYEKIIVLPEEKAKKMLEDETKKSKVKILNTYWAILTWGEANRITKQAQRVTPEGFGEVDWYLLRDLRLKASLKKWDLKDDKDNDFPVSGAAIDVLPSEIANALLQEYDRITSTDGEEEKNF